MAAIKIPFTVVNTGIHRFVPMEVPASCSAPARPLITVSTKFIPMIAIWVMRMGIMTLKKWRNFARASSPNNFCLRDISVFIFILLPVKNDAVLLEIPFFTL